MTKQSQNTIQMKELLHYDESFKFEMKDNDYRHDDATVDDLHAFEAIALVKQLDHARDPRKTLIKICTEFGILKQRVYSLELRLQQKEDIITDLKEQLKGKETFQQSSDTANVTECKKSFSETKTISVQTGDTTVETTKPSVQSISTQTKRIKTTDSSAQICVEKVETLVYREGVERRDMSMQTEKNGASSEEQKLMLFLMDKPEKKDLKIHLKLPPIKKEHRDTGETIQHRLKQKENSMDKNEMMKIVGKYHRNCIPRPTSQKRWRF
eukprot:gene17377-19116_t